MSVLTGVRVVELEGIGPGPMAAMLLSQMGADVIRIGRPGPPALPVDHDLLYRGRPRLALDLKNGVDLAKLRALIERADVLIEGFRPGVCEALGIGPDECLRSNPRLVYGRMTGWGQTGPLAHTAGHDINYLAISGALHAIGTVERPIPPLNLVGDFGGGALYLAFGIACALFERCRTGVGQVVDAAIVDGAASLLTMFHGLAASGQWVERRASNLLDGGCPVYDVYLTKDERHVAVGCLEPKFYATMIGLLGLADAVPPPGEHLAAENREGLRRVLADTFRTRTRDDWAEIFEGTDACVSPVLSLTEAAGHEHNRARGTLRDVHGVIVPQPAPRFSASPAGETTVTLEAALRSWGVDFAAGDPADRDERI